MMVYTRNLREVRRDGPSEQGILQLRGVLDGPRFRSEPRPAALNRFRSRQLNPKQPHRPHHRGGRRRCTMYLHVHVCIHAYTHGPSRPLNGFKFAIHFVVWSC